MHDLLFDISQETTNHFSVDINIPLIYDRDLKKIEGFYTRFEEFIKSFPKYNCAYEKSKYGIKYYSQNVIPIKVDRREPILIILGNPAPSSVMEREIFSYEGNNQIHRMWKVLHETQLLVLDKNISLYNNISKNSLLNSLSYDSKFRIGFYSFFSAPSHSSDPKWSGVAGLQKLFGQAAFKKISEFEVGRFSISSKKFFENHGKILCFQKDAYNLLVADKNNSYDSKRALIGELRDVVFNNKKVSLIGMPPTRLLYSQSVKEILKSL